MLNPYEFILKPEYFDHYSDLHGIRHTYRVMVLVWKLGNRLGMERERDLAFMSAFIHDMARRHDGFCTIHGKRAVQFKLPVFKELFLLKGATSESLKEIAFAVHFHCKYFQPNKKHPFFNTLALLKDADALDRVRLGANDLNPKFLRFQESKEFIQTAESLYFSSLKLENISINGLCDLL